MYEMRLKNLRTLNLIRSLITSKIYCAAARYLSNVREELKYFVAEYSTSTAELVQYLN